jgi:hypothetical protein
MPAYRRALGRTSQDRCRLGPTAASGQKKADASEELRALIRMSDTAYAVESFHVLDDGQPEKHLTIAGWFHARVGVRGMQLAVPDRPIMIPDCHEPSPGLISMFGDTGRNCRFKLDMRIDAETASRLPAARLLILLENNDGMTVDISSQLIVETLGPEMRFTPEDEALVMRFEGLGDNCEFGLMQRKVGRERLSLLRYGGSRETHRLVDAVRHDFEGFATPDDLHITTFHSEWIATSHRYGFNFHTGEHVDAMSEEQIRAAESTKLTFMAGKLVEDIESATKVFVRRVADDDPTAGMLDLYEALRAKGPATLLWVTPATDEKPHGTVEHVTGRLFHAFHGHFAPYSSAVDYAPAAWVALLRQAEAAIAAHDAPAEDPDAAGGESWRLLTGDAPVPEGPAPEPVSEIPEPSDDGGFIGRLFGRKRQDSA